MNSRLLAINTERQTLYERLAALSREEHEILTGTVRTENDDVDFSMFKDTTRRLLIELWDAPDKMLSKEDIRQDVILDEYASDKAVKNVIARARYELAEARAKFTIENVFGKGYQLVPKKPQKAPKRRKSLENKG